MSKYEMLHKFAVVRLSVQNSVRVQQFVKFHIKQSVTIIYIVQVLC